MTTLIKGEKERGQFSGSDIRDFIMAGNAKVTFLNTETGNRFTYKVSAPMDREKDARDFESPTRFVSLLTGPDNWNNYSYIGCIFDLENFTKTAKSNHVGSTGFAAFTWVWNHRDDLPEHVEVWHEGQCGRCGRSLTVPESIARGLGPVCAGKA